MKFEPTKQDVASELVGHEMEEPVLSPKQAKVDAAIEPFQDQVEVAKVTFQFIESPKKKRYCVRMMYQKRGWMLKKASISRRNKLRPLSHPIFLPLASQFRQLFLRLSQVESYFPF